MLFRVSILTITLLMCRFASRKQHRIMEKSISVYEKFAELLLQYRERREDIPVFVELCSQLHVSPTSLNSIILEQTGMTGEDIIEDMRAAGKRKA